MANNYLNLTQMRSNTVGAFNDYSRKYLFYVTIQPPSAMKINSKASEQVTWFISKTETPHQSNEKIDVPWMNSSIKVPGKTKFDDWSVTVRDAAKSGIYEFFQEWLNLTFNKDQGTFGTGYYPNEIISQGIVANQIDEKGNIIRSFKLFNAFVIDVAKMSLEMSSSDINTFEVSLAYDYYKII